MFSDELQMLIDAATADGEITEKERAVLHKRAIAEGVDPDELDIILDSILLKNKKATEKAESQKKQEPRPLAYPAAKKLSDEISNIVNKAKYTIQEIRETPLPKKVKKPDDISSFNRELEMKIWEIERSRNSDIQMAIDRIVVPNVKEEYLEMFSMTKRFIDPNYESSYSVDVDNAFKKLYETLCLKVAQYFPEDPDFDIYLAPFKEAEKERLQKEQEEREIENDPFKKLISEIKEQTSEQKKVKIINDFILPKDRDVLLELILFLKPYAKKNNVLSFFAQESDLVFAYKKKFKQVCEYVNIYFPGDETLANAMKIK